MPSWNSRLLLLFLLVAGCGTPPGTPVPKPIDYNEESQAIMTYRKVAPLLEDTDGVQGTFLTSNNNPRRIVVLVRDEKAAQAVKKKFGSDFNGLPLRYEEATKATFEGEDAIEAVQKVEQPKTWWEKVVFFLKHLKSNWLGQ